MTQWPLNPTSEQVDAAVARLKQFILRHYPGATFRVERGIDDPEAIHLVAFIDFEDTFDVLEIVSDQVMDVQINDGVPIFVIPMRPGERTLQMSFESMPAASVPWAGETAEQPGPTD